MAFIDDKQGRVVILVVMGNITVTEICKKCGECCKHYPFVELSAKEIVVLEEATGLDADVFTNAKGKVVEEYFLQFQENGNCFFLNENNGCFFCSVYEARPEACRKYPSKPIQKKTCDANSKKSLSHTFG
jgi:Fe-S-cluster containining protein